MVHPVGLQYYHSEPESDRQGEQLRRTYTQPPTASPGDPLAGQGRRVAEVVASHFGKSLVWRRLAICVYCPHIVDWSVVGQIPYSDIANLPRVLEQVIGLGSNTVLVYGS